jgi:Protein of unknown function (DUF3455)
MSAARIVMCSMLLLAAACQTPSSAGPGTPGDQVPPELLAPAGAELALRLQASGTQNYRCTAGAEGAAQWKLVAPEATLRATSDPGSPVQGTHGAGPSWTLTDGSGVVGDASQAKRVPSKEPGAIPWLLVPCKDNGSPGALQGVTFVQRLNTQGGAAPATGCESTSVGSEVKVPYSATYLFLRQH